jgi:hypothetical protein
VGWICHAIIGKINNISPPPSWNQVNCMENPPHAFSPRKAILLLIPLLAWVCLCLVLLVYYQPAWRLLIGENPDALLASQRHGPAYGSVTDSCRISTHT